MPEIKPYQLQVWRVNVRNRTLKYEPVPDSWVHLGGRGLVARFLLDEVPATCEPLGPYNKLIFAPGLLVGHMLSSCDRISVGGKSPLTRGAKEANAGGTTGLQMTLLGIKALILEDIPAEPGWWILHLSSDGARFDRADEYTGMGVYETAEKLVAKYGEKVAISLIGPGGEMKLTTAGIQNLDKEKVPSRIAARGGLGAVMGTKGIKAIIFDASGGQKPPIADPEAYKAVQKIFNKAVLDHPQTHTYRDYGTAAMVQMCQYFGSLPTRNFSAGQFEQAESISGESMRDLLLKRGGVSNSDACLHAGLHDPLLECLRRGRRQDDRVTARIRDHRPDGLEPGHRLPGLHCPDELAGQRHRCGFHRCGGRAGCGRGGRLDEVGGRRPGAGIDR